VTGHQRLPAAAVAFAEQEVPNVLTAHGGTPLVGITSLAAGADQLFARIVLGRGGRLHVVVPCERYEASFTDDDARRRFEQLLLVATEVEVLPFAAPSQDAYLAAGRRVVDLADGVVAIWDGEAARGRGGTGDVVAYAREAGRAVWIVWPRDVRRQPG